MLSCFVCSSRRLVSLWLMLALLLAAGTHNNRIQSVDASGQTQDGNGNPVDEPAKPTGGEKPGGEKPGGEKPVEETTTTTTTETPVDATTTTTTTTTSETPVDASEQTAATGSNSASSSAASGGQYSMGVVVLNRPWINEFHYDNVGSDVNEFIEVAIPEDYETVMSSPLSSYSVVLYNGFYGRLYASDAFHPLDTFKVGETVGGVTFLSKKFKPQNCTTLNQWCGLQNGRDGMALAEYMTPTSGRVLEFWSYEGTITAKDGPATNMTSANVGVFQYSDTPIGWSLAKAGIGCQAMDFTWATSRRWTPGTVNSNQTVVCETTFINEFHYQSNSGGDEQFIEIASNLDPADDDELKKYRVVFYDGSNGMPTDSYTLDEFTAGDTDGEGVTFFYYEWPTNPDTTGGSLVVSKSFLQKTGLALTKVVARGEVVVLEFISVGGSFTAQDGVAFNMTSTDVGVEESDETPAGSSLQLAGEGCAAKNFKWKLVEANNVDIGTVGETKGKVNIGQDIVCVKTPPPPPIPTVAEEEDKNDDLVNGDDDFLDGDDVYIYEGDDTVYTYEVGTQDISRADGDKK